MSRAAALGIGQQRAGIRSAVINGFSDLILAVFGAKIGRHARSAIGVAALPFNIAVEIEGEAILRT